MARRNDAEHVSGPGNLHAQPPQYRFDLRPRNAQAQQSRHVRGIELNARARRQMPGLLGQDNRPGPAAGDLEQQAGGPLDGALLQPRIDTALETLRGIGMHAETPRAASYCRRVEESDLEEDVAGVVGDAALLATHDARDADRTRGVRDDQHVGLKRHLLAVQQLEAFPGPRVADVDPGIQPPQVVGMHRLAEFQHHVIRNVHDGTDGTQSRAPQPLHHPQRRDGVRADVAYHASCKTGAGLRRKQANLEAVRDRGDDRRNFQLLQRRTTDRREFPRDTGHGQRIASIRRQVQLQERVVQAERLAKCGSRNQVVRQFQDPFVALAQSEFPCRTQHPG